MQDQLNFNTKVGCTIESQLQLTFFYFGELAFSLVAKAMLCVCEVAGSKYSRKNSSWILNSWVISPSIFTKKKKHFYFGVCCIIVGVNSKVRLRKENWLYERDIRNVGGLLAN